MNRMIIGVFLAVCVAGTGCGKKAAEEIAEAAMEKSIEKDGGKADVNVSGGNVTIKTTDKDGKKADINISEDKMTIESSDGKSTYTAGAAAKVPENFPSDVLVYAGAKVNTAMTVPDGFSLMLVSSDAAEKILGKYKSEMAAKGWKEMSTVNMDNQNMVVYKKDNRTVSLIINSEESERQIALTVMSEGK